MMTTFPPQLQTREVEIRFPCQEIALYHPLENHRRSSSLGRGMLQGALLTMQQRKEVGMDSR